MGYLKYQANRIFDGDRFWDGNHVLITHTDGTIESIVPHTEAGEDIQGMEGILTPGLINCHCHLELSHLKDAIPPRTGLLHFLEEVVKLRAFDAQTIQAAITEAEAAMHREGIVAIGDIANRTDSAAVKAQSKILWQNFMEVIAFSNASVHQRFENISAVAATMKETMQHSPTPHRTHLSPHAPYTICPKAFEILNEQTAGQLISIHNQENPAENELYQHGTGGFIDFYKKLQIPYQDFPVTGKSSLQSYLPYFNNGQSILLVHNTHTSEEDVLFAKTYAASNAIDLRYCLCVNANLYIEDCTPPIDLLMKHQCAIVLGTDSLSSNGQLSIVKEMQAIHHHFPHIPLEKIFHWATAAGAEALQWGNTLGRLKKGMKPGVVLIDPPLESGRLL